MPTSTSTSHDYTILGLDEAGRGCVLGSLYIGGFTCRASSLTKLQETGATDSKKLSEKKRTAILEILPSIGTLELIEVTPHQIDTGNINQLEEDAFIQIISKVQPDIVYIDAPCHPKGIPAVQKRITEALKNQGINIPKFIIEAKADLNYPIVGAASIVAKVNRDEELQKLENPEEPFGSGYPSDPITRQWLINCLSKNELPTFVRHRWGTIEKLKQELKQGQLF